MSKKKDFSDYDSSYQNFWNNFGCTNLEGDDESDEDYNFVEDHLENFTHYKHDKIPYDFSIPKKEVLDILHDRDNLFFLNEDLNNSSLSIRREKRKENENEINYNSNNNNICNNICNDNLNNPSSNSNNVVENHSNSNMIKKRKNIRKRKKGSKTNSASNTSKINLDQQGNFNISSEGKDLLNNSDNNLNNHNIFQGNNNLANASFSSSANHSVFKHKHYTANTRNMPYMQNEVMYDMSLRPNNTTNNNIDFIQTCANKTIIPMETPELVKLLLKQFDFFLQLLIQNVLLSNDNNLIYRSYYILYSFYTARQKIFQSVKLPEFEINFNFTKIFNNNQPLKLRPQISFFQAPLLDILSILVKFMKKSFSKEETILVLKEFFPLINTHYLPMKLSQLGGRNISGNKPSTTNKENEAESLSNLNKDFNSNKSMSELEENFFNENSNKESFTLNNKDAQTTFLNRKKKKFDSIYDNLLMIGLLYHGKKNIDLIQQLWVNSRSPQEIRHRIKNLTCKRAPENIIKKWKNLSETPLTKEEFYSFIKGLQWFGVRKKWNVISRYCLPERSPEYLESVYETLISQNIIMTKYENINTLYKDPDSDNNIANSSTKKKKSLQKELTFAEKILIEHAKEFESEINNITEEIKNEASKTEFYTKEQPFEKFEIEENKERNINYISTRSKNNLLAYGCFNSSTVPGMKMSSLRGKNPVFDFHIKKSEDSAYEKIIID